MKTTSPQQKESGSPDKASEVTQYKEYISKRNQNIFKREIWKKKVRQKQSTAPVSAKATNW